MNYQETIDFLYAATPVFEKEGITAYKPGLERMLGMASEIGNPHKALKCIHVGGTNGKGTVCSTLASIFMEAGYKTGLFTSPHLVSFRERVRINGQAIPAQYVVDFVARIMPLIEKWKPSFFEITTLLCFDYFASEKVDIAIIEVGMGGRLDSTNIISPILSVITNVSLDHTQFLGNTTEQIAAEKAGIIKKGVPIVIGEADSKLRAVYKNKANEVGAPLIFTQSDTLCSNIENNETSLFVKKSNYGSFQTALYGRSQHINTHTILQVLKTLEDFGLYHFTDSQVQQGFAHVITNSHILGRWQKVEEHPTVILDTGHNVAGIKNNLQTLRNEYFTKLHIVFGMVSDKDWKKILRLLPRQAEYYFVAPSGERVLPAKELYDFTRSIGCKSRYFDTIVEGFDAAKEAASPHDLILVGGSNMVVADVIENRYPFIITDQV